MASIGIIETTVSSTVTTDSDSFVEVVESSALTSGKTYYVICYGIVEGENAGTPDSFRLVARTNSDAVLSNSTMIREPNTFLADAGQSYYYLGRFTAGSDGGGVAFEQKSSGSGTDVHTQFLSMLLMDLSELAVNDFFFANDTNDTALTSSNQTFATASPLTNEDDDWLVLGWQATATDVINVYSTVVELYSDIDSDYPTSQMEGEDLTEVLNVLQGRTYSATGGTDTWSIKSKMHTSGASDPNNHLESTLFGLRLNAFTDYAKTFTPEESTTVLNDFVEYATLSFTPTSTEDAVIFGSSIFNPDGGGRRAFSRIQVDGTTTPNTQPDSHSACRSNDPLDEIPLSYITIASQDGSAQTIDLDCKKEVAVIGFRMRALCAFSIEIAKTNRVFTAVASQTYNSGDVAGQTYSSGDIASEVQPT